MTAPGEPQEGEAGRGGETRPGGETPPPVRVTVRLNGTPHTADVEPRTLLADFIRDAGLTGTKIGCEDGACGACTVQLDGEPVLACLTLAVQAHDADVRTIEGLDDDHPLKAAFHAHDAVQCGFCTAGILMLLDAHPDQGPLDQTLRGNLCRCTGHRPIIDARRNAR